MARLPLLALLLLPMASLYSQASNLDKGLLGYWPLNQIHAGGEVRDKTTFQTHGKVSGAKYTAGVSGSAIRLDGKDDVITILNSAGTAPSHIGSLGEGSISIWFKLDRLPEEKGIQPIFYFGSWTECANMFDAANQGIIIEVGHHPVHWQSNRLYFTIFSNGCSVPSFCFDSWVDLEKDRWYHFVAVVGKDYNTGYLDGEPMEFIHYNFGNDTYSQFFEDARSKSVLWLGKGFWDAEPYYLEGSLDELRIYNRPLSSLEVNDLYNQTLSTGVQPQQAEPVASVYPNPVGDRLMLDWKDQDQSLIKSLIISDITGKTRISSEPGPILDVSQLDPGMYMLHISSEEGTFHVSFIKAH
jgi:hypothetical protein